MIAPPRCGMLTRLTRRADYLAAARGIKASAGGFVLQARPRTDTTAVRFGFTVAKRVGNAPARNRVRRRLKELVRLTSSGEARTGVDYVLVGRRAVLTTPFPELIADFKAALRQVNAAAARRSSDDDLTKHRARPLGRETLR